ncbi:MAG: septal ring lytic transglycosylase RlpA family protein [Crocinitomicaceae bacterium]|nr:septal ring lytic transglycosylase RlpA family protein [Crocinitomicaceae bacterium]
MTFTLNKIAIFILLIVSIMFLSVDEPVSTETREVGQASYYADHFHGRKTSSGEYFNQNLLTAAHKTLKFGTIVKVTNLSNDSIVYLKINDRLGRSSHRAIDVTTSAAKKLNFLRKGVAKVTIEKI